MSRHGLIRLSLNALSLSGAPRWLPAAPDAAGFIVTLHHVRPARLSPFDPNGLLSVTPEFLDRLLGHLSAAGPTVRVPRRRWWPVAGEPIRDASPSRSTMATATMRNTRRRCSDGMARRSRSSSAPASATAPPSCGGRRWSASSPARSRSHWRAKVRPKAFRRAASPRSGRPSGSGLRWLTTIADEARQRVAIRALARKIRARPCGAGPRAGDGLGRGAGDRRRSARAPSGRIR